MTINCENLLSSDSLPVGLLRSKFWCEAYYTSPQKDKHPPQSISTFGLTRACIYTKPHVFNPKEKVIPGLSSLICLILIFLPHIPFLSLLLVFLTPDSLNMVRIKIVP